MRRLKFALLIGLLVFSANLAAAAEVKDYSAALDVFKRSDVVRPYFESCYGYAFFPVVGKLGVVLGGSLGEGQLYRDGRVTGTLGLAKISLGFQLGGQAFKELIFFQDQRAYERFISGTFEFDASASAVAVTAAAGAKASSHGMSANLSAGPNTAKQIPGNYINGMAVFTHTLGGLMYEASIGGQMFTYKPLDAE